MRKLWLIGLSIFVSFVASTASASTNFSKSLIVNIDSTRYGDPLKGFPTLNVPIDAGTWEIIPTNPSLDPEALFTAWCPWSTGSAWVSEVVIQSSILGKIQMGVWSFSSGSPEIAFSDPGNTPIQITLPSADVLQFYVGDDILSDNRGGISLSLNLCTDLVRNASTLATFASIQDAIEDPEAIDYDTIQLAATDFKEDILYNRDITLTLSGGYYCDFSDNPSNSSINSLIISDGTVFVENIIIK